MMKILNIVSSIKGDASFSIKLSDAIIESIKKEHPESVVTIRNVAQNPFPYLEEVHFQSFFTPAENHTPEHKEAIKHSNTAIAEIFDNDVIIIGVPFYNFGIPSTLKSWIDHICRKGITFNYDGGAPNGLVTGKKVFLAIASGGIYSDGPMVGYDHAEPYLRSVLGFLGMTDITTFRLEGVNYPDNTDAAVSKALGTVEEFAF
ncbi:FMN-dependent NADH-azoreductase [Flavobacterium zepuense]|uniref:FMN dependent NADH:quinone oxidoreductase n=2 Tax=Flavobacterium zepuense TaxID=2593302 RepID=A0A552V1M9_9FLAO|nr:FMN-dependent NADH-azoreductase [Flavobacterium zepuense]